MHFFPPIHFHLMEKSGMNILLNNFFSVPWNHTGINDDIIVITYWIQNIQYWISMFQFHCAFQKLCCYETMVRLASNLLLFVQTQQVKKKEEKKRSKFFPISFDTTQTRVLGDCSLLPYGLRIGKVSADTHFVRRVDILRKRCLLSTSAGLLLLRNGRTCLKICVS